MGLVRLGGSFNGLFYKRWILHFREKHQLLIPKLHSKNNCLENYVMTLPKPEVSINPLLSFINTLAYIVFFHFHWFEDCVSILKISISSLICGSLLKHLPNRRKAWGLIPKTAKISFYLIFIFYISFFLICIMLIMISLLWNHWK